MNKPETKQHRILNSIGSTIVRSGLWVEGLRFRLRLRLLGLTGLGLTALGLVSFTFELLSISRPGPKKP